MYVTCKKCANKIPVAGRPSGFTSVDGIRAEGNIRIDGGRISFGEGGRIRFGEGGKLRLGTPVNSQFGCFKCKSTFEYRPEEILDEV